MNKIQGDDIVKINKIVFKVILIMILIVTCNSCVCYAERPNKDIMQEGGSGSDAGGGSSNEDNTAQGNEGLGLPPLDNTYKPSVSMGTTTLGVITTLLSVLQVLGVVTIVISIAIMGFGSILGSASEKAAGQEKMVGIVVAAALITGGSIIAKMIISVAEKI